MTSAVAAIERAWAAVDRGEPSALRQCIAAMGTAHDVLVELGSDLSQKTRSA
ncbi:MAG: hypothetical protein KF850_33060 [Labilithrix sp.]|nr:hypothetical protein [Labilithrix sp.]